MKRYSPQLIAGIMLVFLAALICLNKILDIPHYLFGMPSGSVSRGEVFIGLIGALITAGALFYLLKLDQLRYRHQIDKMEKGSKLLAAILGDSPVAIFFIKNNQAVWGSKVAEDILGWPVEKWLEEPSIAFVYPSPEEFARVNKEVIYKDIARRDHIAYEYDYVHKDGHRVPTLVIMRAINKDNLDEGFIFSMIDNTERKKAQDVIKKLNESLGQKVTERTKELEEKVNELERFREATVDRELRMKELKEQISQLKG